MKLLGQTYLPALPVASGSRHSQSSQSPVREVAAVEELRYCVRRGRQLVAAFANKSEAGNWAREYSNYRDMTNTFIIHTADEILCAYRDGDEVEVP